MGFKFVGDNIDKEVKPRFQRSEIRGNDGHYFHGFAVQDRINFSQLSEEKPPRVEPQSSQLLPSSEDITAYKNALEILISRYVKSFSFSHDSSCFFLLTEYLWSIWMSLPARGKML